MNPRLSVIVPVYNVEDYLDECLTSLLHQKPCDFEVICVNDGSTDGSGEILDRWKSQVPWLSVVNQANGGLSCARNTGMRAAKGDYLCFLDSDDRLLPHACRRIIETFETSGAEAIVYGGWALPRDATTHWLEETLCTEAASYDGLCEELLFSPDTRPFAWRNALTRELFEREKLFFDETVGYGEDQVFQFELYARAKRTTVIDDRLYEYRVQRKGSLMSDAHGNNKGMQLDHVYILSVVWRDYFKLGILYAYGKAMLTWVCRFLVNDALMLRLCDSNEVMAALGKAIREFWDEHSIVAMGLEPCEEQVLLMALSGEHFNLLTQRKMFASLHRHLYGRKSVIKNIAPRG